MGAPDISRRQFALAAAGCAMGACGAFTGPFAAASPAEAPASAIGTATVQSTSTPAGTAIVTPYYHVRLPFDVFPDGFTWHYIDDVTDLGTRASGHALGVRDPSGEPLFEVICMAGDITDVIAPINLGPSAFDNSWNVVVAAMPAASAAEGMTAEDFLAQAENSREGMRHSSAPTRWARTIR